MGEEGASGAGQPWKQDLAALSAGAGAGEGRRGRRGEEDRGACCFAAASLQREGATLLLFI